MSPSSFSYAINKLQLASMDKNSKEYLVVQ